MSNEVKMKKSGIHKQLQHKMILYLDGDLEEAEAEKVRSHVNSCPACFQMLEDYRRWWKNEPLSEKAVPSQKLWHNIQARLAAMGKPRPLRFKLNEWIHCYAFPVFISVMISLAVAAGAVIGSTSRQLSNELPPAAAAEEFKLSLFDIAPPGSLAEIFDSPVQPGPSRK